MVDAEVRPGSGAMFDRIAAKYDLLNRVISLGLDQGWRRKLVRSMGPNPRRVLDVATGTADVALAVAKRFPSAAVCGLDPSRNMLKGGLRKASRSHVGDRVALVQGDAHDLPFDDDTFDGACISFGIRNVPDRLLGMKEMLRVTRPGGAVSVLELSEPRDGPLAPFARFHVHHVVPTIGAILSGDQEYRYLQTSIQAFPPPQDFAALCREAGATSVEVERLGFGAAHLYIARA